MPQNAFFLQTRDLLVSQKMMQRHFFSTLHPLSMVIFATATVLAFVLLRDSRFNFHCYTQREATPTQKSAQKCAATSRDFLRKRLQSAFTLANQLCWIAQLQEDSNAWQKRKRKNSYLCFSLRKLISYNILLCVGHHRRELSQYGGHVGSSLLLFFLFGSLHLLWLLLHGLVAQVVGTLHCQQQQQLQYHYMQRHTLVWRVNLLSI